MKAPAFMAVPGVAPDQVSGALTWWRLSGVVSRVRWVRAWQAAGLAIELLPAPVTGYAALKRAMSTFAERHVLVRPLRGDEHGFILVHESYDTAGRPTFERGHEVFIDPTTDDLRFGAGVPAEIQRQVSATYEHAQWHYSDHDISSWLVSQVYERRAVALRDTGGFYFIPRDEAPTWRLLVQTLEKASAHQVYEMPVLRSEEAVRAVCASVQAEAEAVIEKLEQAIASGLTERRAASRSARCERARTMVKQYEELLGTSMQTLTDRLEEINGRLAQIALAEVGDAAQ